VAEALQWLKRCAQGRVDEGAGGTPPSRSLARQRATQRFTFGVQRRSQRGFPSQR
jgi:hypothetical protein